METTAKYKPNVEIASDAEDLAHRTVERFVSAVHEALETRGVFYTALSGGGTPKRTFELIGASPKAKSLPWRNIHVFWVDERYVPSESPFSNYRLAADAFLEKVPIPPDNIHPIPTDYRDINDAAHAYEATLRRAFDLEANQLGD